MNQPLIPRYRCAGLLITAAAPALDSQAPMDASGSAGLVRERRAPDAAGGTWSQRTGFASLVNLPSRVDVSHKLVSSA